MENLEVESKKSCNKLNLCLKKFTANSMPLGINNQKINLKNQSNKHIFKKRKENNKISFSTLIKVKP